MELQKIDEQWVHLIFIDRLVSECRGEERVKKVFQKDIIVNGINYVVDADLDITYDIEKKRYLVSCYEYKVSLLNDFSGEFVDLDKLELEKDLEYKLIED